MEDSLSKIENSKLFIAASITSKIQRIVCMLIFNRGKSNRNVVKVIIRVVIWAINYKDKFKFIKKWHPILDIRYPTRRIYVTSDA